MLPGLFPIIPRIRIFSVDAARTAVAWAIQGEKDEGRLDWGGGSDTKNECNTSSYQPPP